MSTAVLHLGAVLVLLVATGAPPAHALIGHWPVTIAAAPLATGLLCSAAAMVSLVLRAPLAAGLVAVVVPAWAVSLAVLRRRARSGPHPPAVLRRRARSGPHPPAVLRRRARAGPNPPAGVSWAHLLVLAAVLGGLLLAVVRAPVDWDARALWFLHADWLWLGGNAAAEALGHKDFSTLHSDYPPLGPATVAAVWSLLGRDYELAQLVMALMTASAAMVMALGIHLVMRVPRWAATLTGAAVVLGAYGMAGAYATNGYADLLWAGAFVGGTLCLLLGPADDRAAVGLGVVGLAAAMLTKNEGMVAGTAVVVLVAARRRRGAPALAAVPVALAAAWVVISKSLGAHGDLQPGGLVRLARADPDVAARVAPILEAFWTRCRWELVVAVALAGIGQLLGRRRRLDLVGAGAGWLWAATLATLGALGAAYLISPHSIDWHLMTSVDRTTLAPRLLLLVEASIWLVVLVSVWFDRGHAGPHAVSEQLGQGQVAVPAVVGLTESSAANR